MSEHRVPVFVYARDPVSEAGAVAQLKTRHEVRVVEGTEVDNAEVAVVVSDEVDDETLRVIRALQRQGCPRVVLVVTQIDERRLLAAVEAGVCGVLRRNEANPAALARAIEVAARGNGTIPDDLLGRLLSHVGQLQRHVLAPRGLTFTGFTEREVAVLRLLADGLRTEEIARDLCYSERTIKNVIRDITTRLNVRNRSQAVAYALREGVI